MRLYTVCDTSDEKIMLSRIIGENSESYDWPFRFYVRVRRRDQLVGAREAVETGKHLVEMGIVSVVGSADQVETCRESCGVDQEEWDAMPDEGRCQVLIDSGASVTFQEQSGNNLSALLASARLEMKKADFMFGFYMDKQQNAMGATGWDWIKGNVVPSKDND